MTCSEFKTIFFSLLIAFTFTKSYSQDLNVVNCLSGNDIESIKSSDIISTEQYLLNIRTNSDTLDFAHNNNPINYKSSWFFMMNANGDTIWKKILPNSQNALFVKYLNNSGFTFRYSESDFSSQIYTKTNDELILNYSYYDSLSNLVSINNSTSFDSIKKVNNVLMNFGSISISDGSYKIEPFVIDTLLSVPKDTSITLETAITNKINDSIYEMAVVYTKQYYDGIFSAPQSWKYLNLYVINAVSKSVSKNSYSYNAYDKLINVDNRFYWLQYTSFPSAFSFNKIGTDGTIEITQSLSTTTNLLNIDYVNQSNANSLILGGSNGNALIYKINLSNLTFDTSNYNTHSGAFYSYSSLNNIPDFPKYKSPYSILKNTNSIHNSYCLLNESYRETDSSQYIDARYLAKINESAGIVVNTIELGTKKIMDIAENKILLCNDSIYNYDDFTSYYHNNIQQIDSNYNLVWNTLLPDSLLIEDKWYFATSEILDYFPVNYHNQFIVSVFYDEATNSGNEKVNVFFLISNETGLVKRIKTTVEQGSMFRTIYQNSETLNLYSVFCFNSSDDNLSIISYNINQCNQTDSILDIVIYKYNEIVSSIKPSFTNENNISLFPNPTNNFINFKINDKQNIKNASVKIIDIFGRTIYTNMLPNTEIFTIDVNDFASGFYFLQINADDFIQSKKFQVIH